MLYDQVSNDIKEAMKARDKVRLETLRNIKKVFIEAKTAPGANDTLEDAAALLTSSSCHPKALVKEFSYFLMPCHQHGLGVNLLVQR